MADLYRGYEIQSHPLGGFYWTDERGFDHFDGCMQSATPRDARTDAFKTDEAAMDNIDAYKRNMASAS
jgi:hypothetical protein